MKETLQRYFTESFTRSLCIVLYYDEDDDVTCIINHLGAPEDWLTPFAPQFRLSTGGGHAHSHLELVHTLRVGKRHVEGIFHTAAVNLSNNNKQETVSFTLTSDWNRHRAL